MSWVDFVIAAVVIVSAERGLSLGVFRQVGSLLGFLTGFIVGILLVPTLVMAIPRSSGRALVAVLVILSTSAIGVVLGRMVGASATASLRHLKLGTVDRIGGAAFAVVGSLVGCWLVAGLVMNESFVSISGAVANSRLLAVMDTVMPPIPSIESRVQALLRSADFPNVFSSVVTPTVPTVTTPGATSTSEQVGRAAPSVLQVTALRACGVDREGTGFVVGSGLFVTAAHVIAGATSVWANGHPTTTLVYDTRNDIAVLAAQTGSLTPLILLARTPPTNTAAAIVGYPESLGRTITPAAVAGVLTAQGRDIYASALVTRRLVVVNATVHPGNSGSPLMVRGQVAGVVFSRSTSQPAVAYAVPADVVALDLARANRHTTVSRGACLSN